MARRLRGRSESSPLPIYFARQLNYAAIDRVWPQTMFSQEFIPRSHDLRERILPSLTALQFFDAAVRHMSFTRAARELNVTQSAVSRQIRQLEEYVGRPLFRRVKQRLVLTEPGEAYSVAVRDLLDQAEAATLQVMAYGGGGGVLTVALLPTFGSRWLSPGSATSRPGTPTSSSTS